MENQCKGVEGDKMNGVGGAEEGDRLKIKKVKNVRQCLGQMSR